MSTSDNRRTRGRDGEDRKQAALDRIEARRETFIRRGRCALHSAGIATADDVAELVGPASDGIDPRYRGTVPGPLARAGIIRPADFTASARPSRHAGIHGVWKLADRAATLAWLDDHPELPDESDADDQGTSSPGASSPPGPQSLPSNRLTLI